MSRCARDPGQLSLRAGLGRSLLLSSVCFTLTHVTGTGLCPNIPLRDPSRIVRTLAGQPASTVRRLTGSENCQGSAGDSGQHTHNRSPPKRASALASQLGSWHSQPSCCENRNLGVILETQFLQSITNSSPCDLLRVSSISLHPPHQPGDHHLVKMQLR